jgi:hypothetical protein
MVWGKPRFTYLPSPPPHILASHKRCLQDHNYHTLLIIVSPFTHNTLPLATYQCSFGGCMIHKGCTKGADYTQATCQAVYNALALSLPSHDGPVLLYLQLKTIPDKILMLTPHRDSYITFDIQELITTYLTDQGSASIDLIAYQWCWPGTPTRMELKEQAEQQWSAQAEIADASNNGQEIANTSNNGLTNLLDDNTPPKQVMWEKILMDYSPSNHPSHIACPPADRNKPPLGIQEATAM